MQCLHAFFFLVYAYTASALQPFHVLQTDEIAASLAPNDNRCFNFFKQAASLRCTELDLAYDWPSPDVVVAQCESSPAHGFFIIQRKGNFMPGQDVYRLRISGPEIFLLDVLYCGQTLVYAPYSLQVAGSYAVEIFHLYSNFNFRDIPPMERYLLCKLVLTLPEEDAPHRSESQCREMASSCSPGSLLGGSSLDPGNDFCGGGRWAARYPCEIPHIKEELPECEISEPPVNITFASEYSPDVLQWRPHGCKMQRVDRGSFAKHLVNATVCFFGDSQMRHIHGNVVEIMDGVPLNMTGAVGGATDKSISHSNRWLYSVDRSAEWEIGQENFTGCSTVVYNIGQWALGWPAGDRPMPAHEYSSRVKRIVRQLAVAREEGKSVFWVTTNSHPMDPKDGFKSIFIEGRDWRTDPLLLTYNKIANALAADLNIPIIDTYTLTSIMNEYSYDGAHYRGYVGYWSAVVVLDAISRRPENPTVNLSLTLSNPNGPGMHDYTWHLVVANMFFIVAACAYFLVQSSKQPAVGQSNSSLGV